jgi:hypothetical protein
MKGKFEPKWKEPYIIEQVYDGGAYQLVDHQDLCPMPPVNGRYLKKFFACPSVIVILPLTFFGASFHFLFKKNLYKIWIHKSYFKGFSFTTHLVGQ